MCDITLLSSHISTRRFAHRARRRESGPHSKKLKTQWGQHKFLSFLFSSAQTNKNSFLKHHRRCEMEAQAGHWAMCATAASNWSKMSCPASDSSLLYTDGAAAAFCSTSVKLPPLLLQWLNLFIYRHSLLHVRQKNIDGMIWPVVMCVCSILFFMHAYRRLQKVFPGIM